MKRQVLQMDNKDLRQETHEIPVGEIGTPKIKKILADMKATLGQFDDGVALAAPQIGIPLRVFVVADSFFDDNFNELTPEERQKRRAKSTYSVYINPVIKKRSSKKIDMDEGCLSVRWVYGTTKRSEKVTIEAYDENGKKFTRGASGLLAQVYQHETDHLNGILFIDHAKDVEKIIPPEDETNS